MSFSSLAGPAARIAANLTASGLERVADVLRGAAAPAREEPEPAPAPARPRPVAVEHRDEVQVVQTPSRSSARTEAADRPASAPTPGRISNPKRARQVRKRQAAS